MITVKKMYQIAVENNTPLLSNYNSEWWNEYLIGHVFYDDMFAKMYKSFVYFDQEPDQTDEEITNDFISTVYGWLMMNDKRYSELYRIHVIPDDEAYALTNNYDLHETYSGNNSLAGSLITGQRTDVTIDQIGEQAQSGLNKVTGWNSNTENTDDSNQAAVGSREDTHQFTKGQETDTSRSQGTDAHTMRRYGNIGVQSVQDMLSKQSNFWQLFNFYKIVFDDICKNFLLIGRM